MSIKYKQYLKAKQNSWKTDAKRTDENIKYCKECRQCYEVFDGQNWHSKKYRYLPDFPSYKKQRQTCPVCKKGEA